MIFYYQNDLALIANDGKTLKRIWSDIGTFPPSEWNNDDRGSDRLLKTQEDEKKKHINTKRLLYRVFHILFDLFGTKLQT